MHESPRLLIWGTAIGALVLAGCGIQRGGASCRPIPWSWRERAVQPAKLDGQIRRADYLANKDLFPHTATADAKAFDSKAIAPSASWTWVAGKPGTYAYACTFHPTMKATITVR